jgi:hypothetical protein
MDADGRRTLSDEEAEMAGAKGYLKMCICVVGPGDDPPVFCFILHDIWSYIIVQVLCTSDMDLTQNLTKFLICNLYVIITLVRKNMDVNKHETIQLYT